MDHPTRLITCAVGGSVRTPDWVWRWGVGLIGCGVGGGWLGAYLGVRVQVVRFVFTVGGKGFGVWG